MIQFTGINLGQRQHELNNKVDELFTKKESFEQISAMQEKSDADRLLKIDLANLHKNVTYLVDTLKCGDPLYISRALKCISLFEDHNIINPDYVHCNIIPFMSQKMKRKMLTAIAIQIKDQERVDSFYQYCVNHKLNAIALKFLINASQHFKVEYIKSVTDIHDSIKFEFFFGSSYDLINEHIEKKKLNNSYFSSDMFRFSYLFSYSNEKYLNMVEDCLEKEKCTYYNSYKKFGLRMSKIIMTKYKHRVFDKPWLYLGILDKSMIARYSSSDEAKKYAVALLPDKSEHFWSTNFYSTYAFFLDKIPAKELYMFLKHIFTSKYPNELFEMNFSFYRSKYYKLMTSDERHEWALKHIEQKKEHFGPLKDYKWYEFVKFKEAFFEIKKLIYVNKSADIRADLIEVLVKSASQEDIGTLLSYYYERHVNESSLIKERFLNQIIETHNLFKFDDKCWTMFMKLLHSLEAFNPKTNSSYPILAVLYNIIHYKTIPQNLETFCIFGRSFPGWRIRDKLDVEQKELIYNYLKEYLANKIEQLMDTDPENLKKNDVKIKLTDLTWSTITLIENFKKSKEDCPEIVMKVIRLYSDYLSHQHRWFRDFNTKQLTNGDLLRLLKKDKKLFLDTFPTDNKYDIRCTNVLKKIKIYFNDDVAKNMLHFYEKKMLQLYTEKDHYLCFNSIIFNLIQLSDTKFKIKLLTEYAPASSKIVHDEIDKNLLRIQEAICRFMHTSRPPLPLYCVRMYLKGDYVSSTLPIFNSYSAHLPFSASLEFIEMVLDSPVSIQKHGLRLAFESYEIDNLVELITKIWNKTQNSSLRLVIFKAMINKIINVSDSDQIKLYEALKMFIISLRVDDSEDIYNLLSSTRLPEKLFSNFLEEAWNAVDRLPLDSRTYIDRRCEIIDRMATYIEEIDRNISQNIIKDHINSMFAEKHLLEHDDSYNISNLYRSKWNLLAKYITHFHNDQELETSLELLHNIMKPCLDMWNEIKVVKFTKQPCKFIVREFLQDFLYSIKHNVQFKHDAERKPLINPIFQSIVKFFEEFMPINYVLIFDFKLAILLRNIVGDGKYDEEGEIISYKHLEYETVAKNMSQGIIDLVAEKYYPSLSKTIANKITFNIEEVTKCTKLKSDQLIMMVSRYLSEKTKYELRLLALHLIPLDGYKEYPDDFNAITNNIMSSNDYDLNSFLYHNFIWSDFVNRIPQLLM